MRIALVTPARPGTRSGNRHTALRWAAFLRAAGHRVAISTEWNGETADAMLALHARRSHASIKAFPGPVILALTGTDVYHDGPDASDHRHFLAIAVGGTVVHDKERVVASIVKQGSVCLPNSPSR